MVRISLVCGMVAAAAAFVPTAAGAKPTWVADWGADSCSLVQKPEGGQATLAIRRAPTDAATTLLLVDPAWKSQPIESPESLWVVLEPDPRPFAGVTPVMLLAGPALQLSSEDPALSASLARAQAVTLTRGGKAVLRLPVAGTARAMAALHECEQALLRDWGVDPAAYAALKAKPEPEGGHIPSAGADDYPREALRTRVGGTTGAILMVTRDGAVEKCTVTRGSGNAALDSQTCRFLTQRARFRPARDATGNNVPAPYAAQVTWTPPAQELNFKPDY